MAGHSKWHNIRYKKELADKKRAKIFAKLSRLITVAVREKGKDPDQNPTLRQAIERAKEFGMPKENIERAIKRGSGEITEGTNLEEIVFEAIGPQGVGILIQTITDNRNRTVAELRQILGDFGAKLTEKGTVSWMFELKGKIKALPSEDLSKEEAELKAIDCGAENLQWKEKELEIIVKKEELGRVRENLEKEGFKIKEGSLEWIPTKEVELDPKEKEKLEKLFEALDEQESVQEIYSNLKE